MLVTLRGRVGLAVIVLASALALTPADIPVTEAQAREQPPPQPPQPPKTGTVSQVFPSKNKQNSEAAFKVKIEEPVEKTRYIRYVKGRKGAAPKDPPKAELKLEEPKNTPGKKAAPPPSKGDAPAGPQQTSSGTTVIQETIIFALWKFIEDSDKPPHCVHGLLLMEFPNGASAFGSGTLIGPRHVLTAGHNLYSTQGGGLATAVAFIPGRKGDVKPFGVIPAVSISTTQEWIDTHSSGANNRAHDIGLVVLDRDLPQIGHLGVVEATTKELNETSMRISGYPDFVRYRKPAAPGGDFFEYQPGGRDMWSGGGKVTFAGTDILEYHIDTNQGTSGASIHGTLPGETVPVVFGVHVAGTSEGTPQNQKKNFGARITRKNFDYIVEWINNN